MLPYFIPAKMEDEMQKKERRQKGVISESLGFFVLSTMKRVDWDCHMKINIFMIFSFWTLEIEKFKFGSK